MAYIGNSKITKKGNYQKGNFPKKEIICQEIRKNSRKILKNIEKIPTHLESAQNAKENLEIFK